jgi:integrase
MRNENGFGSIICLDKSGKKRRKPWAVRITTGWVNGKQQRKYLGYYTTRKEALVALADYHNNGVNLDVTKLTLDDVWKRWIERVEKKNLSDSVINLHNMTYKKLTNLLNKPIKDIKTIHLQEWMDGIDNSPSTKKKFRSSLSQAFEYAIQNDIISKNYVKFIEITEKIEKTGSIFTEDEINTIWSVYRKNGDRHARLLLMLIYTGTRIGELLAIKREDINLEEQYMIGGSKTEAGKDRVIPIHDKLLPLIIESLGDNTHLITNTRNKATNYQSVYPRMVEFFEKHKFNHTIHDTRRTTISLLHTVGVPMATIKMIVGHSGDSITEKVYLFKSTKELVEAINMIKIL